MKLLHPIFMLGFLFWLYKQRSLGKSLLDRHGRLAKDETDFEATLAKHRFWGMILIGYCFAGLVAGAILTGMVYPEITVPFGQTYGHGYIGALGLGCLVMSLVLGLSIKRVVKPKIRERFVTFHTNIIFLVAAFAVLSLLTGAGILVFGPSQAVTQIQVTP
ncbi:MAG: hypothetical protein BWY66_01257 [bacterium ADurb.Bin374]|nr:MAG: hypothetical protein BWY66_01257 [bacterium ADurb.Bin374]